MPVAAVREARSTPIRQGLPAAFKREGVVYAIAFDLDIEQLRAHYGDPYNNAYLEVRRVLERHPERVIKHTVRGMLPHNALGRKMLRKLKVYGGPEHPHAAQNPAPLKESS